jgi:single-strand DNA-binding protein
VNRINLTGRLTRDPELRSTPNGTSVTTLRIASMRARRRDEVDYFDVVAWSGLAENCVEHLGKGRLVSIDGRVQYREWVDPENDKRRHDYEVIADDIEFLDAKSSRSPESREPAQLAAGNRADGDF